MIDLEVRELSSSNVLPDADGDIVEQLCARQTASFLRQLAELGVIDSTESMSEQLAINWQKEGF